MSAESVAAEAAGPTVLVIDDDPLVSVVVRRAMEGVTHRLHTAPDGRTGIDEVVAKRPDLVVLDNILPDGLGVDALTRIHELAPTVPILFVTARGSGGTAIEAMKLSAFDYLPKPLDPAKLRLQIDRALSQRQLLQAEPSTSIDSRPTPTARGGVDLDDELVGECPAMQSVFKAIGKVATQDVAVLVRGEPGTGKESVAHEIHRHSHRCDGPLVKMHCRDSDAGRLTEELFGDAHGGKGRIADAAGGTLVMQEVGALPPHLQSRVLRAVRDRVYETARGATERAVDCRFVVITTEDIETKTRAGDFRSDLYYALSSFVIELPALRQRRGDLPLLIAHSLRKLAPIAQSYGVAEPRVTDAVLRSLCEHVWPGNIDELESVLKRALVEQKGNLLLPTNLLGRGGEESVVPATDPGPSFAFTTDWSRFADMRIESGGDSLHAEAIAEMERKLFKRVLGRTGGNQAQAARHLGITRASLRKKLRLYGMAPRPLGE